MITSFDDILKRAETLPVQRAAVLYPDAPEVMKAVKDGIDRKYIEPVLVGVEHEIRDVAKRIGLDLKGVEIIHVEDRQKGADFCVDQAITGNVDFIIKGQIMTSFIFKSILRATKGLVKQDETPCTMSLHQVTGLNKLFAVTDPGLNIYPDLDSKYKILNSAVAFLRGLEFERIKIMALSAKRGLGTDPVSANDGDILRSRFLEKEDGQVAFIDRKKGLFEVFGGISPVDNGFPDLFLVPNLDTGNILCKTIDHLLLGVRQGVTVGAGVITLMPSRSDRHEVRILSTALGKVLAHNQKNNREK